MFQSVSRFFTSVGFGNLMLALILGLSAINVYSGGQILESVRNGEIPPMSSTHTVTVSGNSFTFTITTPWRSDDTGATLAARHWADVQAATAKIEELMGA